MGWVKWQHRCEPPQRSGTTGGCVQFSLSAADGMPGDLWRCDDCPKLWRLVETKKGGRDWRPAPWWLRLWYRRRKPLPYLAQQSERPDKPWQMSIGEWP